MQSLKLKRGQKSLFYSMHVPVLMERITSEKLKRDGEWRSGTHCLRGLTAVHGSFGAEVGRLAPAGACCPLPGCEPSVSPHPGPPRVPGAAITKDPKLRVKQQKCFSRSETGV